MCLYVFIYYDMLGFLGTKTVVHKSLWGPSTLENSRTFLSIALSFLFFFLKKRWNLFPKDIFLVLVGLVEMATSGTISAGESSVQRLIRALKAFRCFRMIRPKAAYSSDEGG